MLVKHRPRRKPSAAATAPTVYKVVLVEECSFSLGTACRLDTVTGAGGGQPVTPGDDINIRKISWGRIARPGLRIFTRSGSMTLLTCECGAQSETSRWIGGELDVGRSGAGTGS